MENKIQLLKPRNFGDVMNETFAFAKEVFKPLLQVILYVVFPVLIVGSYFYSRYMSSIFSIMGNTDPYAAQSAIRNSAANIFLGMGGIMLASILLYLAVVATFLKYEASEDGNLTASDILSGMKKDFLSFIGFIVVFTIVLSVSMVLLIGLVIAVFSFGGKVGGVLLGIAMFFGFFYLMITMAFTPFIYMRERNGILEAISRAFYLIKGHWWQTLGIFFATYMVVYLASLVFIIPFYAIFFTGIMHGVKNGGAPSFEMGTWGTVSMMFMFCGMFVLSSLINMSFVVQYYSLVERKDGVDIMQQIENLGTTETPQA
ncbi:MAG: hypothetical protein KA149_05915 [Chitinophagales bacterium]|nr:hypothetical protein [Chitinophagales bacterium]